MPTGYLGRMFAVFYMYTGVFVLALPISVMGNNFEKFYELAALKPDTPMIWGVGIIAVDCCNVDLEDNNDNGDENSDEEVNGINTRGHSRQSNGRGGAREEVSTIRRNMSYESVGAASGYSGDDVSAGCDEEGPLYGNWPRAFDEEVKTAGVGGAGSIDESVKSQPLNELFKANMMRRTSSGEINDDDDYDDDDNGYGEGHSGHESTWHRAAPPPYTKRRPSRYHRNPSARSKRKEYIMRLEAKRLLACERRKATRMAAVLIIGKRLLSKVDFKALVVKLDSVGFVNSVKIALKNLTRNFPTSASNASLESLDEDGNKGIELDMGGRGSFSQDSISPNPAETFVATLSSSKKSVSTTEKISSKAMKGIQIVTSKINSDKKNAAASMSARASWKGMKFPIPKKTRVRQFKKFHRLPDGTTCPIGTGNDKSARLLQQSSRKWEVDMAYEADLMYEDGDEGDEGDDGQDEGGMKSVYEASTVGSTSDLNIIASLPAAPAATDRSATATVRSATSGSAPTPTLSSPLGPEEPELFSEPALPWVWRDVPAQAASGNFVSSVGSNPAVTSMGSNPADVPVVSVSSDSNEVEDVEQWLQSIIPDGGLDRLTVSLHIMQLVVAEMTKRQQQQRETILV